MGLSKEEKAALAAEKKAEKERKAAEKKAEKERKAAEKKAEKERKAAEKLAKKMGKQRKKDGSPTQLPEEGGQAAEAPPSPTPVATPAAEESKPEPKSETKPEPEPEPVVEESPDAQDEAESVQSGAAVSGDEAANAVADVAADVDVDGEGGVAASEISSAASDGAMSAAQSQSATANATAQPEVEQEPEVESQQEKEKQAEDVEAQSSGASDGAGSEVVTTPTAAESDGDGSPDSAVSPSVAESEASHASEKADAVPDALPESRAGTMQKRRSRQTSFRGAPMQLHPAQSVDHEPTSEEDKAEVKEYEVIEDEVDEQVGQMVNSDSLQTYEYLQGVVDDLRAQMIQLWSEGTNRGYQKAYQELGMVGIGQSCDASRMEANRLKNRYGNIMAYDAWRVKLPIVGDDPHSDYINASYVDGYKHTNGYIASQGPVPNSFIDFWRMVWHFKSTRIVMVTHEIEKGRMKCHRYWPDPTSNPPITRLKYGDVIVSHLSSVPHKHFIVRTFLLQSGDESREVKQFFYTSWPDHGVPLTTQELLGFRNAVNHGLESGEGQPPIIIHCSAGVGRTGTYIAIDTLVKQALDMGGKLDVDATIALLRQRRNYMVQTEVQYMFIFRAVLDALSELLKGESLKAEVLKLNAAEQEAIRKAADAEDQLRQKELAKERAEIEAAKKELMARGETSAANAAAVVSRSIQDRVKELREQEDKWLENYTKSLDEWNERNQFEAEQYDLTSSLTPVQSRLEALKQKGMLV
eukprot:m.358718 g.358718  ORF g.358718 m.358718 type:complete len:752 (+) comp18254_c0_seq1:637-2892(+)